MELAKYALVLVAIEKESCKRFKHGLRYKIRTLVTSKVVRCNYVEMVDAALRLEKSLKGNRTSLTVSGEEEKQSIERFSKQVKSSCSQASRWIGKQRQKCKERGKKHLENCR